MRAHRRSTTAVTALLAAAALASVAAPAVAAAPRADTADPARHRAALQRALNLVVAEGVPGAVAEVRDGHGVWRGTGGVADLDGTRRPAAGDRFRAGSTTKSFVATVVLQLVAEKKIGLDDPVERRLPGLVPAGAHGDPITVRQLLNHTSGLRDYLRVMIEEAGSEAAAIQKLRSTTHTPRELIATATAKGLKDKGTFAYSNTNYAVLGLLVERTTGHHIGDEITRRIIRPLHLRDTSFPTGARIPGRHLQGYEWYTGDGPTDLTGIDPSAWGAAGALISTTHDLNTFYRALSDGKLLPAPLLKQMHQMSDFGDDRSYGLGLEGRRICGPGVERAWGHSGSVPGFNTLSFTTADGKRQVTLAVNRDRTKTAAADAAVGRFLDAALCSK